jgi:chromosome segregation ATPase
MTAATLAPIAHPGFQDVIDAIASGHTLRDWQRSELIEVLDDIGTTLDEHDTCDDYQGRYQEAVNDLARVEQECSDRLTKEHNAAQDRIDDLQASLDDAQARVDSAETRIDELTDERDAEARARDAAQQRIRELERELDGWERHAPEALPTDLRSHRLAADAATIATLRAIVAQQADMIATLRQHLPARIKAKLATV